MEEEMVITAKRLFPASCISCKNDLFNKKDDNPLAKQVQHGYVSPH